MENSFSLQFNKMTQLKTAQEYEKEIESLQNENWEIKHQLAYLKSNPVACVDENIQKLLYDSKTSIDILEGENKNYQKQIDHMKEIIRNNNLEKDNIIKDYTDRLNDLETKILNLEDENNRLITHIENMKNKYENIYQEHKLCGQNITMLQNENNILQNNINSLNNTLANLQNENYNIKNEKANYFSEGEKLLKENERLQIQYKNIYDERNNLHNINNEFKQKISSLEGECNEYERKIKNSAKNIEELKEVEMYFKELQKSYNKETRDKQNLALENENLKNDLSIANKKIEIIENEKRAMKYKLSHNDGYIYEYTIKEINKCKDYVDYITKNVKKLQLKNEAVDFLNKINIKEKNFNSIVSAFKTIYQKMKEKIEVLRREAHDLSKFNKNEKLMKIIKDFTEEFKAAKNDLNATKVYLEKKNAEIKEIKKEKNGIQKMYNSLLQKYNRTTFKL